MKYLSIILCLLFVGCSEQQKQTDVIITPKPKRQYVEQICPKCDETGSVQMTTGQKAGLALVTLGMGLLCDEAQCDKCGGKGIIKVPVPSKKPIEE